MSDSSRKERIASYLLAVTTFFFLIPTILSQGPVKLKVDGKHVKPFISPVQNNIIYLFHTYPKLTYCFACMQVIIDNGLLQLTLTNPEGYLAGVSYNGIDNILQKRNKESGRAYVVHFNLIKLKYCSWKFINILDMSLICFIFFKKFPKRCRS